LAAIISRWDREGCDSDVRTREGWGSEPEVLAKDGATLRTEAGRTAGMARCSLAPAARLRDEGLAVTPGGKPVTATVTVPEKALTGTAFTAIFCPVPPEARVIDAGVEERLKSACGVERVLDPPPHEVRASRVMTSVAETNRMDQLEHPSCSFDLELISTLSEDRHRVRHHLASYTSPKLKDTPIPEVICMT